MPYTIKLSDLSTPQAWIIPDSSSRNAGLMTPEQAAQLAALVAGGGIITGDWVRFDYAEGSGYTDYVAQAGVGKSRNFGDYVQLSGIVAAPVGGTGGSTVITILPADQRPDKFRIMTCSYESGGVTTAFDLIVDDTSGFLTGFPGALFVQPNLPNDTFIPLDGLSFLRSDA